MAGGVTVGFRRSRALVGEQTVSWSGEACALHSYHSSEPFAASRVCDERSGTNRRTALDPAPASQALPVSLDFADAFIDGWWSHRRIRKESSLDRRANRFLVR